MCAHALALTSFALLAIRTNSLKEKGSCVLLLLLVHAATVNWGEETKEERLDDKTVLRSVGIVLSMFLQRPHKHTKPHPDIYVLHTVYKLIIRCNYSQERPRYFYILTFLMYG